MINLSKPYYRKEEYDAVLEIIKSNQLAQGRKVEEFENKFKKYVGSEEAIAVSNGTAALHVALLAEGIKQGDEVITTPFTFPATINTILHVGAKPIFIDVKEDDFTINPYLIEKKISERTKAILPIHIFGSPADLDNINKIAKNNSLKVIEDCAQAIGTEIEGKHVGSKNTGCFSLYATKNISTIEGGMITTNNQDISEICRLLRNHGKKDNQFEVVGFNYRMDELRAALGISQLNKIEMMNEKRLRNAKYLNKNLNINGIIKPKIVEGHSVNQYTIRITKDFKKTREEVMKEMKRKEVETCIYYHPALHKQELYKNLETNPKSLRIIEKISKEVLSLPIHPSVTLEDLDYIIKILEELK